MVCSFNLNRILKGFLSFFFGFLLASPTHANEVHVAVAANFAEPMKQIAIMFQQATGHRTLVSLGSTGKFYAQIKNGAPFDILLAADQLTPMQLEQEQTAVAGSQFTYAIGALVLWSPKAGLVNAQGDILKQGSFAHLAIASPAQSPYGKAAQQTLAAVDLFDTLSPKMVQGESIGQTYSFVVTGNAELGFVALSQVWENHQLKSGSLWIVPDNLYTPLRQDAILLNHGKANQAAWALLAYLKTNEAKNIIRSYGYRI